MPLAAHPFDRIEVTLTHPYKMTNHELLLFCDDDSATTLNSSLSHPYDAACDFYTTNSAKFFISHKYDAIFFQLIANSSIHESSIF